MFKPAKSNGCRKMNFRYHLLKVDGEWYLMESIGRLSSPIFCPWFVSFDSHKAYQLTEDEVES